MPVTDVLEKLPLLRKVEQYLERPIETQERLLRDLLVRAADTEWGRRYDFASIAPRSDLFKAYRETVPTQDYEAYRSDVDRLRQGESDIIWPGSFQHFAVSSGTASKGKIIPLSAEMLGANRLFSLTTAFSYLRATGNPRYWLGKLLSVPGRIEQDERNPDNWIGEMSGLMYLFAPWAVKQWYQAVPEEVLFMRRWEDKLAAIVDRTRTMDVRAVAMVPSWAVVLFPMLIERHNKATGDRATTVREIWPNLQVFFSGAVALSSYEDLMREQIGPGPMHFIESYGASEGVFSFQTAPEESDMLLHLDNGVYFEFVRMDDQSETPRRYSIAEVETDVRYSLLVTSCSGLWSYPVGDVVRFTSVWPHRIVVAGRTSEMVDRYGEAVFGEEARAALEQACQSTGARVRDYHLAALPPSGERPPRHQWLVEFEQEPPELDTFSRAIDAHLQEVNRHYVIRRECNAFDRPEIVAVPQGTFLEWLKSSRKQVSAQTKVPRMSEERDIAEAVLRTAETISKQST